MEKIKSFEESLEELYFRKDKLYYNYLGIAKQEYPKWEGWKIISKYKEEGIHITEIQDEQLDILVENFYHTIYLQKLFDIK